MSEGLQNVLVSSPYIMQMEDFQSSSVDCSLSSSLVNVVDEGLAVAQSPNDSLILSFEPLSSSSTTPITSSSLDVYFMRRKISSSPLVIKSSNEVDNNFSTTKIPVSPIVIPQS